MKLPSLIISLLLTAAPAVAAEDFQPEPGFISLFNGKDLTGWHYKDGPEFKGQAASSDERYTAKDGVFTVNPPKDAPRKVQQIWTVQEFPKNFILKLEFRAAVNA